MESIRMDVRPSVAAPALPALALPAAAAVRTAVDGLPQAYGRVAAQIPAQACVLGINAARLGWLDRSHPTISYRIHVRTYSFSNDESRNDNSMAHLHLAADATFALKMFALTMSVSTMCDRKVSAPRAQLISVSSAKDVDAYGIPPRGAPD